MIPFESLLETYGYVAVFIGAFAEGETMVVLGGFAAQRGYLFLPGVILAALIGSLCADQLFFYLGRRHTQWVLEKFPLLKAHIERAHRLLERFRTPVLLGFRFMYGLRAILPFVFGMSSVSRRTFIILDVIAAIVWAVAVGTGGYLFGHTLEVVFGNIRHYELIIIGAMAIIGLLLWALHRYNSRKRKAARAEVSPDS